MAMQRLFSKLCSFSVHSAQTLPSFVLLHCFGPALRCFTSLSLSHQLITNGASGPFSVPIHRSNLHWLSLLFAPRHSLSRSYKSRFRTMNDGTIRRWRGASGTMRIRRSYKSRFRTMNDGTIRRWRAGKRHNAHSKSKISKRRLRVPALVHPAYATVMKKLNFCG